MLKTLLGPQGFKAGMDHYFAQHDGQAATVEDFVASFAAATGRDLSQFMLWYRQSGTPRLSVRQTFEPTAGTLTLTVEQSCPPTPGQPTKQPMLIPLALGLVGEDGRDLVPEHVSGARIETNDGGRIVVSITEPRHDIVFTGLTERPVPSLLRGFSAPVRLDTDLDTEAQLFLLARDSDPFNRWQSAQTVSIDGLKRATRDIRAGLEPIIDESFVAALMKTAADDALDPAFRALVLTLPGEAEIAREEGENVDPDAIRAARDLLKRAIAAAGTDLFAGLHARLSAAGPYHPDAAGAGRRALANIALDYLAATGTPEAFARVETAYALADNMTDRLASLGILVSGAAPAAERVLADFYRMFAGDALVIDKWFTVQATAPNADALERVIELTRHPAFSLGNPNRVRSLITAFATGNQTQFNRPDGAGYRFIAERGIDLDKRNPQVAARLLSAFRSWRALEAGRRGQAETALRSIAAIDALSPDVADIVQRCLA